MDVEVYYNGKHVATIAGDDYIKYRRKFDAIVEEDAIELYKTRKDELIKKHPGEDIADVIGSVLAERLQ